MWRSTLSAAVGGCALYLALPHPTVRTALLVAALFVAALAAGARAVTTRHPRAATALGLGVLVHGTTTGVRHLGVFDPTGPAASVLDLLHASSFVAGAVSLLFIGLRAGGRARLRQPAGQHLETSLRRAVAAGALSVYYQPIVDARSGRVGSVEALVRWDHPTLGLLGPGAFLPAAERAGLMVDIGRHVLDVACAELSAWRGRWPHLALAVNVSERELLHPDFAAHVTATLQRHALPPSALRLELTETVAVNEETIAAVLEPLALAGVALSIDDFGTGHSSLHRLNQLRRLPVQRLKIDKSFVDELGGVGEGGGPLLASMITLAHSVGHCVVAEGVETHDQAAFLARHGCDELQGYLYSRPLPAEQVTALLPRIPATTSLKLPV
jgi:EAL domain-containing protein (putative c-di-GMP-specific phosphodiesterase class I)